MNETKGQQATTHTEAFLSTMALYAALSADRGSIRVRRAVLRGDGEVFADPLDFICDIELKGKRTFTYESELLLWRLVLTNPDNYENLPAHLQQALGKTFLEYKLDPSGHYRTLFFRIKNQKKATVANGAES